MTTPGQERGLARRALLRNALITGAGTVALGALSIHLAEPAYAGDYQDNWGWCTKCSELFWATAAFTDAGACPAPSNGTQGNMHTLGGTNYSAMYDFSTEGSPANTSSAGQQAGWRWCKMCYAMFWPSTPYDICPGNPNGSHFHVAGDTNYAVPFGIPDDTTYQPGWCWCDQCGCLYWGGQWGKNGGYCVYGGAHVAGSKTHYQVIFT